MRALAGALGAALLAGSAAAAPPADLDAWVRRAMQAFDAPGMAVAIVENGRTTLAEGYGVRKLGEPARVDPRTLFPIGSDTKAFTAAALAILVDEKKLAWDGKVGPRLPGFQMYDPVTTGEMTITDLLSHRSGLGLGEGDLLLVPHTDFTPQEIVERLRYLKPKREFRSGYAYDNVLYIAAGRLIEEVSGQPWGDFVHTRIFAPLGMTDAVTSFAAAEASADYAWPHGRFDGPFHGTGHMAPYPAVVPIDNAEAAGGINIDAIDIAKWLRVQLAQGALPDGRRVYSDAAARAMWTPQTLIPVEPAQGPTAAAAPRFQAYALGWEVRDWRGHKIITHDGGVFGSISEVTLIPDLGVGFAIMTNCEEAGALRAVAWRLLDHYLSGPPTDWIAAAKARQAQLVAAALAEAAAQPAALKEGPGPSLPLSAYAGSWRDPWYGEAVVAATPAGLSLRFTHTAGMEGVLQHVRYDTFRTHWKDRAIEDAYVTFSLDAQGRPAAMRMAPVSPLADFSFDYRDLRFTPTSGG